MTLLLKNSNVYQKPIVSLANALRHDREALLQILLSISKSKTFSRIVHCPTYPVPAATPDLKARLQLLHEGMAPDPYEISNVLAVLYESATEKRRRKSLGQYFTPSLVAKQAIDLLALKQGEMVLDPGCGTGIFPLAILSELNKKSENAVSLGYLGIENDPILALSAAVSLDWVDAPLNWRVLYANFLRVNLEDLKEIDFPRVDVIIANPPFVRYHKLGERIELMVKLNLSMFSGLHSIFLAHSSKLVGYGRMVFIVPMEMGGTQYGSDLLKQLRRKFTVSSKIIYYGNQMWHVEDSQELTLEKYSQIRKVWNLMLFQSVSDGKTRTRSSRGLRARKTREVTVPLGFFASVHRGISTGANKFFVLSDEMVEKMGISVGYLKKVIPTRIRKVYLSTVFDEDEWDNLREKGLPCWLLCLPRKILTDDLPFEVRRYIKKGERLGIHLIPTCKNRKPWYYIRIPSRIPDLVFTYMARGYPKFIYNKACAYNLTNLLGIYLNAPIRHSDEKMVNLTKLLNNELKNWIDQESAGRKYAGGLIKFEPGDLETMPIHESTLAEMRIGFSSLNTDTRAQSLQSTV